MLTKPRNVPRALTLRPEVNLLTEFAVIATSPQSPLVREVSRKNADARQRKDDTPPRQLVDLKQMVCDRGLRRERHMPSLLAAGFFPLGSLRRLGLDECLVIANAKERYGSMAE